MSVEPSGPSREQGTQVVYQDCPVCGNGNWKVYMNPNTGGWICFRCEARGYAQVDINPELLRKRMDPAVAHEWHERGLPEYEPLGRTARKYLKDRGIHRPEKFGLVELTDAPRILIPYRGLGGKIIYWNTRSYVDDGKPKYMTAPGRSPFYVLPKWAPHEKVTVVEGVFDAIVMHLATGGAVIGLGGKSIARYSRTDLAYLAPGEREVMLDGDAAKEAIRLSREYNMRIRVLPHGVDPAEYYKERIKG